MGRPCELAADLILSSSRTGAAAGYGETATGAGTVGGAVGA
jgi:hypothetical protein